MKKIIEGDWDYHCPKCKGCMITADFDFDYDEGEYSYLSVTYECEVCRAEVIMDHSVKVTEISYEE
jgi:hypothetical protein